MKVNRLLLRNLTVTGVSMDSMDTERPGTLRRVRDSVQSLLAAGRIHPKIGSRYGWDAAVEALVAVETGTVPGKVVVAAPR